MDRKRIKKIAFNLLPYTPDSHGGAEFYLRSVASALSHLADRPHHIVLIGEKATVDVYRAVMGNAETIYLSRGWTRNRATRILAEQTILPLICARNHVDCIVSNYVSPIFAPVPQVVIVHDMLFRRYPELFERSKLFYWKAMIPASLRRSASIVTVSRFSADEIAKFYPSVRSKLFVTVEGIRSSLASISSPNPARFSDFNDYLVCIATFGRHKNLHMLVRAMAALPDRYANTGLALIGAARTPEAKTYQAELHSLVDELGLSRRVVFCQHVAEEDLVNLYRGAVALITPSLYEGFGLPVIEAQYHGCPVLCSNAASLPEIAGPAAITFDPSSVTSIRDAIVELLESPSKSGELRRLGYENVKRFSWEAAAQQLRAAIEFACNG